MAHMLMPRPIRPSANSTRRLARSRCVKYDTFKFKMATIRWFYDKASIFGRTPKIPTGTGGNPNFRDFMNPKDSPATQARQVLAKLRGSQKASLGREIPDGSSIFH